MHMRFRLLASLTLLALALFAVAQSRNVIAADPPATGKRVPVIVELFTSEGCSDCPPADTLLRKLQEMQPIPNAEVIVLGNHVDYWNHDGWTDRFSSRSLTERQQQYSNVFHLDSIYTPQMVVDGKLEFNGQNGRKALEKITEAAREPHANVGLTMASPGSLDVKIDSIPASAKKAEVLLAITESGLQSEVRKGENEGKTLTHTGVVRDLRVIGKVDGQSFAAQPELRLKPDWKTENLTAIVFVQEKGSRHIVGAAETKLAK